MRLPDNVTATGINREAEYDALFRMPPMKLARIFHRLSQERTQTVVISIRDSQGVSELSFIKQRPDPNLDRGSDSDSGDDEDLDGFQINANDVLPNKAATIVMEDRIKEVGIEKALCMTCLHEYINTITSACPATEVTMYMGTGVPTFMVYTVPGEEGRENIPPLANHYRHPKSVRDALRDAIIWEEDEDEMVSDDEERNEAERVVQNQKRGRAEDGDGDGDEEEDEEQENEEDGEGVQENKRQRLNAEDGGGDGDGNEADMVPNDGHDEEMVPNDGDDDEMVPKEGDDDDEMVPKEGDDDDEMVPKDGDDDEMVPKDGDDAEQN